jgi:hypothetical protein
MRWSDWDQWISAGTRMRWNGMAQWFGWSMDRMMAYGWSMVGWFDWWNEWRIGGSCGVYERWVKWMKMRRSSLSLLICVIVVIGNFGVPSPNERRDGRLIKSGWFEPKLRSSSNDLPPSPLLHPSLNPRNLIRVPKRVIPKPFSINANLKGSWSESEATWFTSPKLNQLK